MPDLSYHQYDVIVIGGGHAGCEAALAAARLGAHTLLLTFNLDHVAQMSCNPAIGGIAKGQVVREIDALGGEMGRNTDATAIACQMLNRSRGPAVWSPRAQCDKLLYQRRMKHVLERTPKLVVQQAEAVRLLTAGDRITGVVTEFGETYQAKAVVLATGTFLGGLLHYGPRQFHAGRAGDRAAEELARCLRDDLGLRTARLKTGTPPRVLGPSIDFTQMQAQEHDPGVRFSHWADELPVFRSLVPPALPGCPCYLLATTERTRGLVLQNLHQAPMYNGQITAIGTRYCPSFEDKVMRFRDHPTHHLFLEPEGAYTEEYYLNGLSTSLPVEVQWELVHSVPGLERAQLSRFAYAVEYDFVFPNQLDLGLAVRRWPNLFLAGQINGTTGYEEAAGQGLVAGINAALFAGGGQRAPLVLGRDQAYLGVMIDDLTGKEITEPYRLFTSRAEYRLLLRQDNAARRLAPLGHDLGLLPAAAWQRVVRLEQEIAEGRARLQSARTSGLTWWQLVARRELDVDTVDELRALSAEARQQLAIEARYEDYIVKEAQRAAQLRSLESWRVPADFSYDLPGIRVEAQQKLERLRPLTLAQAARVDGVTPAEIALLQVHLKRRQPRTQPGQATGSDCGTRS